MSATRIADRMRSVLFVPGNRPDLAAKAPRSKPDVVIVDLEDAVPPQAKADARNALHDSLSELSDVIPVWVRVNAVDTSWFAEDVAALPHDLTTIVVPKLESASQVAKIADIAGDRTIVAGFETVRGVVDVREVMRGPVAACYFGAEDYIADLGGVRTDSNFEVTFARSFVAMAARVAGIPALDMVTLEFGDTDRFVREAGEARSLGYAGKMCIHPAQVPLANDSFRPSAHEVDWAQRLLGAFTSAGSMTIAFEGQMVDEVVAARARSILDSAGQDQ